MAYQQQNNVKRWSINNNELPLQFQHKYDRFQQSLPENLGQGFTNIFQLDHHLTFMETDYRPSKDLSILNKIDSDEPRLIITLSLKGNSCFSSNQGNTIFLRKVIRLLPRITPAQVSDTTKLIKPSCNYAYPLTKSV